MVTKPTNAYKSFNKNVLHYRHSMPVREVHYKGHITKVFAPCTNVQLRMVQKHL